MQESLDSSFKIYVDPRSSHANVVDDCNYQGPLGPGNGPYGLDMFLKGVDSLREDMKHMEKIHMTLNESHEEIKAAQSAKAMMNIGAKIKMDLDNVVKLAKQVNRKFDGLVRANAAQRKMAGNGPGSTDDQARGALITELGEGIKHMMRKFQGLRAQMETENRQLIESRYYGITREKATAEVIDNLIASEVADQSPLHQAMQEHGRGPVLDAVAEIQERRDTMREIRRNLMVLHQILLGIASPVAPSLEPGQIGVGAKGGVGGPASPIDVYPPHLPPATGGVAKNWGTGQLNDYEKETRKQAYFAIAVALFIILCIIAPLLYIENQCERDMNRSH